jgi:hypothetical protein
MYTRPPQTFEMFEKCVRHAVHNSVLGGAGAEPDMALSPTHCLLLVHVLERRLFAAAEGVSSLPPTPERCRVFFRGNKKVMLFPLSHIDSIFSPIVANFIFVHHSSYVAFFVLIFGRCVKNGLPEHAPPSLRWLRLVLPPRIPSSTESPILRWQRRSV